MDTPSRQRRYSEEEQATALAALTANGGNAALTAAQLGIPERTLRSWRNGEYSVPTAALAAEKRDKLARGIRKLTGRVLRKVLRIAKDKDAPLSLRDGMVALGIGVDKLLLLEQASGPAAAPESDARLELFRKHFGQAQVIAQELHLHLHLPPSAPPPTPLPIDVTPTAETTESTGESADGESG